MRPGLGAQALVPLEELLIPTTVCKPGPTHPQVLHQAQVLDLVRYNLVVENTYKLSYYLNNVFQMVVKL